MSEEYNLAKWLKRIHDLTNQIKRNTKKDKAYLTLTPIPYNIVDLDDYIRLDMLYLYEYKYQGLVGSIYHDLHFKVMIKLTYSNN